MAIYYNKYDYHYILHIKFFIERRDYLDFKFPISVTRFQGLNYFGTRILAPGPTGRAGLMFRANLANPSNPVFKGYASVIDVKRGKVELLNVKGKE